jgi:hypothetical protein
VKRREESVQATVSEIHRYPLRPAGYAEPLFHCRESRREILEHLARSSWLHRASEATPASGRAAHVRDEAVDVVRERGIPVLKRRGNSRRIVRVLECWREVREWWSSDGGRGAALYRVELSGGASEQMLVLDLARDLGSSEWTLVGVVD